MLITLWVFTGVESAFVLSAHAKKKSDVGLATVLGIIIALALYVAITVLSYGLLPRHGQGHHHGLPYRVGAGVLHQLGNVLC